MTNPPLVDLRHELHRRAELSGRERRTAACVVEHLRACNPDDLIAALGGHGVAAVFAGAAPGPTLLVRADLDALPLPDRAAPGWASTTAGVSHRCGHDGHAAMLLGLARALADRRPARGRAVLLFQPAEETGHGARAVLADPAFAGIAPDRVLAVHNLPGFPLGTLVLREGPFASASCGLEIILTGVTSHAAEPERGLSPVPVAAELALQLPQLPAATVDSGPGGLVTVVGVDVGSDAFGVSPGTGRVLATLRTASDDQMAALRDAARRLAGDLAARSGIAWAIRWHEEFPGTANDANIVGHLTAAAERAGIPIRRPREPFRWSEDFGHFTARWPGALVGLGSGESQPPLHHPDYDFPDALLEPGVAFWRLAVEALLSD